MSEQRYRQERARIEQGHVKYREKLKEEGKLFVRDRLKLLLDPGTEFQEDFLFARNQEPDTPADGVVTGVGTVGMLRRRTRSMSRSNPDSSLDTNEMASPAEPARPVRPMRWT